MRFRSARFPVRQQAPTGRHPATAWASACLVALALAAHAGPPQPPAPPTPRKPAPPLKADAAPQLPGTDLEKWCKGIAAVDADGGLERCRSLQLTDRDGRSVKGVPLWSTDVLPPAFAPTPLRVLVLGGIHADEEASVVLVMDWIVRARQPDTSRPVHWRMAPLVNPDGFFRATRTRVNANGVDLNRNFATRAWSEEARKYWITTTRRDPRRFPGNAALSEPESRWVHQQIDSFRPHLIVSVHAPYGVLDFDGPPPPPSRLGNLMLDQVGIYPGSLGNYGGLVLGVPVVTIELKQSTRVTVADASAMWNDLQRWIGQKFLAGGGTTRIGADKVGQRALN